MSKKPVTQNIYHMYEDYCEIELITSNYQVFTKIDLVDVERCKQHKWTPYKDRTQFYVRTPFYAYKGAKRQVLTLHKFILNAKPNEIIDHINGDSLDNRGKNLHVVTAFENATNRKQPPNPTTGVVGVYEKYIRGKKVYGVTIRRNGYIYFRKYYDYTQEGLQKAKQDFILARNYIYKDVFTYNPDLIVPEDIIIFVDNAKKQYSKKPAKITKIKRFKEKVKWLDGYRCAGCGRCFSTNPDLLEVHHIRTRKEYPEEILSIDNCISLCRDCHFSILGREKQVEYLLDCIVSKRGV